VARTASNSTVLDYNGGSRFNWFSDLKNQITTKL